MNSNRMKFIVCLSLVTCFILVSLISFEKILGFDVFWHLRIGRDLLEGILPTKDYYSFSFYGESLKGTSWIFDGFLYVFCGSGNPTPFWFTFRLQLFKLILMCGAVVALFFTNKKAQIHPMILSTGLILLTLSFKLRSSLRPEISAYLFICIYLFCFFQLVDGISDKRKLRIGLILISTQLCWVNTHSGSSALGFVLGFGIYLQMFVSIVLPSIRLRKLVTRRLMIFLLLGLLFFLTGFATTSPSHTMLRSLTFESGWSSIIQEYKPLPYRFSYYFILSMIPFTLLHFWQKQWGKAIVTAVLLVYLWKMQRLYSLTLWIVLPLLFHSEIAIRKNLPRLLLFRYALALLLLINLSALVPVLKSFEYDLGISQRDDRYPQDCVEYMNKNKIGGRILNSSNTGGYLLFFLEEDGLIYLDGRTNILYSYDFVAKRAIPATMSVSRFEQENRTYQFDSVLAHHRIFRYPQLLTALASGTFSIDFAGKNYFLLRKSGRFSSISRFLGQPIGFLKDPDRHRLNEECRNLAEFCLSEPLKDVYLLLLQVLDTERPEIYLDTLHKELLQSRSVPSDLKLIAAFSLYDYFGRPDLTEDLFSKLPNTGLNGYLFFLRAGLQQGKFEQVMVSISQAKTYLKETLRLSPEDLFFVELNIYYDLAERKIEGTEKDFLDELTKTHHNAPQTLEKVKHLLGLMATRTNNNLGELNEQQDPIQ